MSNVRQSLPRRRAAIALAILAFGVAACDARATAPADLQPAATKPVAIEGDTLSCKRGWAIVAGVVVCNDES
ncbi:MAG: hypothetical protein ACREOK_00375 [Gemmatimonadaceae bacterium]